MTAHEEPAYQRVLIRLRDLILAGTLAEGDRLPTIRQLAEDYNVTTGTAARAVAQLRAEGFVISRHGSGSYVRKFRLIRRSSPRRLRHDRWATGRAIQDADTEDRPRSVNVVTGEIDAPGWVASSLQMQPGDRVAYRTRQFVVNDRAVQLATSYLPVELARGTPIMHTDTGPGGVYARLAETGHAPATFTEYLRARMPVPDESEQLSLPNGTPVIEVTRQAFDKAGACVEVNRMILDGSAYVLDYTFSA